VLRRALAAEAPASQWFGANAAWFRLNVMLYNLQGRGRADRARRGRGQPMADQARRRRAGAARRRRGPPRHPVQPRPGAPPPQPAEVHLLANRVELDGHVDANGRFRTLGTVRTEMRSVVSVGVLETGTDHNLLIRRNAVAHIELRGNDTSTSSSRSPARTTPSGTTATPRAASARTATSSCPAAGSSSGALPPAGAWAMAPSPSHRLPGRLPQRPGDPPRPRQPVLERPRSEHNRLHHPHLVQRQQRLLVVRHRAVKGRRRA
jgi:hypothetical protein